MGFGIIFFSPGQFRDVLNSVGLGNVSSVSNRVFEVLDTDASGHIDWHEFLVGISVLVEGSPKKVLQLAFNLFDNNRNGTLSFVRFPVCFSFLASFAWISPNTPPPPLSLIPAHEHFWILNPLRLKFKLC